MLVRDPFAILDVDAWLEVTHFSKEAQAKAATLFASLPPAQQGEFGSPEKLVATLAVEAVSGFTRAAVLGVSSDPSGAQVLRSEVLLPDGRIRVKGSRYENFEGAWQTTLRGDVLEMYADLAARRAAAAK